MTSGTLSIQIIKTLKTRDIYTYLIMIAMSEDGKEDGSVTRIVPESSMVGPLLWYLVYDVLWLKLRHGITLIAYTDDLAIV